MRVELRFKIERRRNQFADNVLAEIGAELLQRFENRIGIAILDRVPIDVAAEIRHGREDVEALTTGRRERRIDPGRRMEIVGEIDVENIFTYDDLQQFT